MCFRPKVFTPSLWPLASRPGSTSELGLAERVGIEPTVPLPGQQFSRLPDSATLAPLRVVELASRQGRVGANVSSLRSAVGGAYPGDGDFSIGFLSARRASSHYSCETRETCVKSGTSEEGLGMLNDQC